MLKSKATDDDIDKSDDENQDSGGVVEDVSCLVVLRFINIYSTKYQEHCSKYHLNRKWGRIFSFYKTDSYLKNNTRDNQH